ncbi:dihydroorotase [Oecophyllibacter saccharovorans]|uniref:dihydroorotase n=1 Tax=Oecophyllibacter saccharovorans TaxID=2558360 RepID=UPI001171D66B|nr:dihydroorotase [Oecophyllibacter saccharovorans]TPW36467.1 dihydroorotase [Oecophyllibacter saccharovorans]
MNGKSAKKPAPGPDTPILFTNVRLIDPASGRDGPGSLLVEHGRISAIDPSGSAVPANARHVDGQGAVLAPGLVDLRASLGEPGAEYRETLRSGSEAAVAGGITSIGVMPDTDPAIDTPALLTVIRQRGEEIGLASLYPHGALTRASRGEEMTEMGLLQKAGALAFTDGVHAIGNTKQMRNLLSYAHFLDALVMLHPQDIDLSRGACATSGLQATRLGLPQVTPAAEAMMVARDLRLAEMTGARVHLTNISTAEALDLIRNAKARGLRVSCDTAPPYFSLTEEAIGDYRTYAKLTPPLRLEKDRLAVRAALADGTIDAVTSDHSPADADDKRLPFAQARAGGTGLVTLLGVTLASGLSLLDALRLLTVNPARLLGLEAGTLSVGAKADLCLFDPQSEWTVHAGELPGLAQNTPFDGWTLKGRVLKTFREGREVYTAPATATGHSSST